MNYEDDDIFDLEQEHSHSHYGLRLVGMIPYSDNAGVDIDTDEYIDIVKKRRETAKEEHERFLKLDPMKM